MVVDHHRRGIEGMAGLHRRRHITGEHRSLKRPAQPVGPGRRIVEIVVRVMTESEVLFVDEVFPEEPVRQ